MTTDQYSKKQRADSARSPVPAYLRIEENIRGRIADGSLAVGTRLASRHNLAKEYGVALSTVQQAFANLIADGVLESFDRNGTFVARAQVLDRTASPPRPDLPLSRAPQAVAFPVAARPSGMTLGIVTTIPIEPLHPPDIGGYWARQVVSTLERAMSGAGGASRFFNRHPKSPSDYPGRLLHGDTVPMADAISALRAAGSDAFVIVGLHDDCDLSDEIVSSVDIDNVPVVYITWHEMRPPLTQISYDNTYAGYQAAKHLLNAGYRRLTFLSPFQAAWLDDRETGVREAVRQARLPAESLEIVHPSARPDAYEWRRADASSHAAIAPLFQRFAASADRGAPWGVIAPNDHTAYAVMQAAEEAGLRAGADFGLIGFDDDSRSSALSLSSVRPPLDQMAEEAVRLLLGGWQGKPVSSQVRLRSNVIARASTALAVNPESDFSE
ncbi:hypothetical protein CCAX7_10180 [Capsulimonas corticalis]|uniref:Uncharacterized protein n=1 Tax=Capsulimonas corticalis TaxID=2219043 RepID=A0A402CUI0_9BACT|nr:substrate-binding domain-containing protein [Capsulimonas corticalis]BDI28967.1 hypothetical protein CCAX7_10180 [Capsulimonas corticalis]